MLDIKFDEIFLPDEDYEVYPKFGTKEVLTNNML